MTRNIVFLCSGGGANMRFVHQSIARGWLRSAQIIAIITDRPCAANLYADANGMKNDILDFSEGGHAHLEKMLGELEPDIIISNIHRILLPSLVQKFQGKIINLHYSLLPAFGGSIGIRPVKDALAYGAKFTGVTVHEVTAEVDAGRPLVQAAIALNDVDQYNDVLMDAVFRSGCLALLTALQNEYPAPSLLRIHEKDCFFSSLTRTVVDESCWAQLKEKSP
jgi:phosphoribosylglycinamide formyltransferase-1